MELNVLTLRHALTLARLAIRKISSRTPHQSKSAEEPVEEATGAIPAKARGPLDEFKELTKYL